VVGGQFVCPERVSFLKGVEKAGGLYAWPSAEKVNTGAGTLTVKISEAEK